MRTIIEVECGSHIHLKPYGIDLNKHDIARVWTVYDVKQMWDSKYNPYTGKRVESLEELPLQHHHGVFIEDKLHDWDIQHEDRFRYYTRVVEIGESIPVLFEYHEKLTKKQKAIFKTIRYLFKETKEAVTSKDIGAELKIEHSKCSAYCSIAFKKLLSNKLIQETEKGHYVPLQVF